VGDCVGGSLGEECKGAWQGVARRGSGRCNENFRWEVELDDGTGREVNRSVAVCKKNQSRGLGLSIYLKPKTFNSSSLLLLLLSVVSCPVARPGPVAIACTTR
jgi:hypothetical protein